MLLYAIITLICILFILVCVELEKEKRSKYGLIIELEDSKETSKVLTKEYNTKLTALNQRIQELVEQHNSALNRFENASNERDHYKNKSDSLTKEVNSLKGKLSAKTKLADNLFTENSGAVLKIAQLEEQLLFANNTPAAATQAFGPGTAESEQVPEPEQTSQPTTIVRKPRRPRARGNKQPR